MTGDEEQILATPRYVKSGKAIDMIFEKCLQESYKPDELLSSDRTLLLISLRIISYGHEYEVQLECPGCNKSFNHAIKLNDLMINDCPEDFHPPLVGILPVTKYKFSYRLSRGKDEQYLQTYRDDRINKFGTEWN